MTINERLKAEYIKKLSDKGIRHKCNVKTDDYLNAFLDISREFAFATHDGTWGELEKNISIMANMLVKYEILRTTLHQLGIVLVADMTVEQLIEWADSKRGLQSKVKDSENV